MRSITNTEINEACARSRRRFNFYTRAHRAFLRWLALAGWISLMVELYRR